MATVTQIQNGMTKYIDEEMLPNMPGWQRWVFGAAAVMMLNNLPATMERLRNHEIVKMMNVIDDSGEVDVPKIYQAVKHQSAKGPVTVDIPGMGSVKLNDGDVDKIYKRIMQTGGGM